MLRLLGLYSKCFCLWSYLDGSDFGMVVGNGLFCSSVWPQTHDSPTSASWVNICFLVREGKNQTCCHVPFPMNEILYNILTVQMTSLWCWALNLGPHTCRTGHSCVPGLTVLACAQFLFMFIVLLDDQFFCYWSRRHYILSGPFCKPIFLGWIGVRHV